MNNEPLWVTVLSALLTPMIAVVVAWIAYLQWRLGQNKLKLDLFDRRFSVYEGARSLLSTVCRSGVIKDEDLFKFRRETREAKWLFNSKVDEYLRVTLYLNAIKLAQLQAELEGVGVGDERTHNVNAQRALKEWLMAQEAVLDEAFSKFLKLASEA